MAIIKEDTNDTLLEKAFRAEVIAILDSIGITIDSKPLLDSIVDELVNGQDDMWEMILSTIRNVATDKISQHISAN